MASFVRRGRAQWQVKIRRRGHRHLSKTFPNKRLAEQWAADVEGEMARGTYSDRASAERTTLADAVEAYIKKEAPRHKGGDGEVQRLRKFLRDEKRLARRAMADLRTEDFEDWRDRRLKAVKPGTVKRELGTMQGVVQRVYKKLGLRDNLVRDVKRPRVSDSRHVRLSPAEEARLLAAADEGCNPWVRPAVQLAIRTALRRGELLALCWEDVDLENGSVWLSDTKNGEARRSSLTWAAVEVLQNLGPKASGPVLAVTVEGLKQGFARARKAAGLEHVRFHDLRHEGVSRLLEMGLNEHEVRMFSGHKDPKSFMRYANLRAGDVSRKTWAIERRLREREKAERPAGSRTGLEALPQPLPESGIEQSAPETGAEKSAA